MLTRNNFSILWIYLGNESIMLRNGVFVPTVISISYPTCEYFTTNLDSMVSIVNGLINCLYISTRIGYFNSSSNRFMLVLTRRDWGFLISNINYRICVVWINKLTRNNLSILWAYLRYESFMLRNSIFIPATISIGYPISVRHYVTLCIGISITSINNCLWNSTYITIYIMYINGSSNRFMGVSAISNINDHIIIVVYMYRLCRDRSRLMPINVGIISNFSWNYIFRPTISRTI